MRQVLQGMAGGNLDIRLNNDFSGAVDVERASFNNSVEQAAMRAIGQSAASIHTVAHKISDASDNLARRTEQQAASIKETAAALDQIVAVVVRHADES